MRPFTGDSSFFVLGEELVHLCDDRFQLPGVWFASRPLLKRTPTLGFPGKIGPLRLAGLLFWHRRPPTAIF
jgi:hypothetical protein